MKEYTALTSPLVPPQRTEALDCQWTSGLKEAHSACSTQWLRSATHLPEASAKREDVTGFRRRTTDVDDQQCQIFHLGVDQRFQRPIRDFDVANIRVILAFVRQRHDPRQITSNPPSMGAAIDAIPRYTTPCAILTIINISIPSPRPANSVSTPTQWIAAGTRAS